MCTTQICTNIHFAIPHIVLVERIQHMGQRFQCKYRQAYKQFSKEVAKKRRKCKMKVACRERITAAWLVCYSICEW